MKTYYCNSSMKTNLDTMYHRAKNLEYDFERGIQTEKVYIDGAYQNFDTISDLVDELYDLWDKAMYGKVSGKEYGRIKQLQIENQNWRYEKNIKAGRTPAEAMYSYLT